MATQTDRATAEVEATLAAVFAAVQVDASVHAVDVGCGAALGLDADRPWVLGSVFKVPIMLTFACEAAVGRLDPELRVHLDDRRSPGPTGISALRDPVELSLRDLAFLMMSLSDNAATDAVLERVGIDRVNELLVELGLVRTRVREDCGAVYRGILSELGPELQKVDGVLEALDPDLVSGIGVLDPGRASAGTAAELTTLLRMIWRDEAGPPAACAEVRHAMEGQVWLQRLATAMPQGGSYAGKTGTLPGIRNEIGVVTDAGGATYALAVLTRAHDFHAHRPDVEQAIGEAGRVAVRWLQQQRSDTPAGD